MESTNRNSWLIFKGSALFVMLAITAAPCVWAEESSRLVGSWSESIQPVDCQTGTPTQPVFPSLSTFNLGGTMTDVAVNSAILPLLRSPGHGIWKQNGQMSYEVAVSALITNNGAVMLTQVRRQIINIGNAPNQFTASETVQFFDLNGHLVRSGCATVAGQRLP